MQKEYKSLKDLLAQYCPTLVAFYGPNSRNWKKIEGGFARRLALLGSKISSRTGEIQTDTTIFDLLQRASDGHKPEAAFLRFIDSIVSELVSILDKTHHPRLRKSILHPLLFNFGKDNLQSKYLEPVGELVSLRQLLKYPRFQLQQIEFNPRGAKDGERIDFCFRDTISSTLLLVEVLNIEIKKEHLSSAARIKDHLYTKVKDKIADKTKSLNKLGIKLPNLSFLVILWCFDLKRLADLYPHYLIAENEFEYPLLEFCTFAQRVDAMNNYTFVFGTVESVLQMHGGHHK